MNEDHRDSINLYATKLLAPDSRIGAAPACDLMGSTCSQTATLRLDFPERVTGPGELRKMLVKLADEARREAIADTLGASSPPKFGDPSQ